MNHVTVMTLGGLFDRTFKLIGQSFSRNVIIALVVFVPATLALVFALDHFIGSLMHMISNTETLRHDPWPALRSLALPILYLCSAALLMGIGHLLMQIAMMSVNGAEMIDEPRGWLEALGESAGRPLMRAIGASILQSLALSAAVIIPFVLIVSGMKWIAFLGVFAVLGGMVFAIYMGISWVLIIPIIAVENDTIIHAFTRSSYLVRDYWWRTLGVLILLGMASQLAVSLISTPLSFIAMWGFWTKYFTMLASLGSSPPDPKLIMEMFSGIGIGYGAVIGITLILSTLVQSSYMVVMYYDLRARKGEFGRPAPVVSPSSASSPSSSENDGDTPTKIDDLLPETPPPTD
jgi:hypothetical protein